MGKIQYIKKSRKERKCFKCGNIIKVGEPYKKGVINFHPDIVVCDKCPLKSYEVTTSEYCKEIGAIVEDWAENFSPIGEGTANEIAGVLEGIRDEVECSLENVPENLKEAPTGELLQTRLDQLEEAIDTLNNIDEDTIKSEAENDAEQEISEDEFEDKNDYENAYAERVDELFEEKYSVEIDEAISSLEY